MKNSIDWKGLPDEKRNKLLKRYRQFMANPNEDLFWKSLGLEKSSLTDEEIRVIRHSWNVHNRFDPPEERIDQRSFFSQLFKAYSFLSDIFSNVEKLMCDIQTLQDKLDGKKSNNLGVAFSRVILEPFIEMLEDLETVESINSKVKSYGQLPDFMPTVQDIEYDYDSTTTQTNIYYRKQIAQRIRAFTQTLVKYELPIQPNPREVYVEERYHIWLESIARLTLSLLKNLGKNEMRGHFLMESISLLHFIFNSYNIDYIGISSKFIGCYFNALINQIGLNSIPIYGIDFAAYTLDVRSFAAYVIYIIREVEGQDFDFDLPEWLYEDQSLRESEYEL